MKWAYATGPPTGRASSREGSSSVWFWRARWSPNLPLLLADEPTGNLD